MRFTDNPLFINTVILGGTPEEKIQAAAQAGFSQIELWRQDVQAAKLNAAGVAGLLDEENLTLTDYQVLLDFDGAPVKSRQSKRREALLMLDTAVALGASTLLTPASTADDCIAEREEDDIRWLVKEAAKRGLRVALEAMAWSTHISDTAAAWRMVKRIDQPNLGLVVDAFHIFVRKRGVEDLAGIPVDKIFLVQLSDLSELPPEKALVATARHERLLPGEGIFPLHTLLDYLDAKGYCGPLGLEVFNDNLQRRPAADVAKEAMSALKSCWSRARSQPI
ncbi:sugar phosphate isomerase/epimerase family protein [Erwinia psidii]|uniref:Sugar phosphate isomerase/epimerase n=1 Tax=Erwinia psidii TaxID=69224 RepID=A0A3N6S104_9GAMM|nr:sugar phosphate isomerase/epimerase family protein [Erwinia psidii]MCX8956212.1 sugar phosphate isomerase/epimerase [Erwinia psidii]MCX8960028.1 sugar phosphate isomerase/epimerase [Erwinia psidii]MCX8963573.1 sugar phosphate isomerase/epimerase [Erwinia psidii]RQM39214.1 sugar phosphate isomerase/epimerase [Erwinia psidii]